jgi:hypothetical protein
MGSTTIGIVVRGALIELRRLAAHDSPFMGLLGIGNIETGNNESTIYRRSRGHRCGARAAKKKKKKSPSGAVQLFCHRGLFFHLPLPRMRHS